jgi:hypothetical protein
LLHRLSRVGDRRQLLIVDNNLVGGILRGGRRFGDDHGHWFAHMHHSGFGKRRAMRRDCGLSAAPGNWVAM